MEILTPTQEEFEEIRKLVYDRFGINLTSEKKALVAGRLQKVLRVRGFETFSAYLQFVERDASGEALEELVNRISTNHTFFYREKDHFDFFTGRALPEAIQRNRSNRDLRIWSAGCSSGEEPYTLVMLMMETLGSEYSSWSAGVLATDISARALEFARKGVYPSERLEPLPVALRNKYFHPAPDSEWEISEKIRQQVTFRSLNLMNRQFPFRKQFDVIFCRNVMIYFDQETRMNLVQRFCDCLVPGGFLFIGHSESIRGGPHKLEYLQPALYRKGDAGS